MKVLEFGRTIVTGLLLQASIACAKHNNVHLNALERKHRHHNRETYTSKAEIGEEFGLRTVDVEKRGGQCQFPSDANLVAVTPGKQNAGWAMSPDQPCTPGNYCPYACPPGQMMAQWDPDATSYTYPQSMVSRPVSPKSHKELIILRMAAFTVIRMATFTNLSLTRSTAWVERLRSAP